MNRIYFVRHGENPANLTKEFSCRSVDYSLTPKGQLQAQQTAEWFVGREIDAVYASPLKRALETAQTIAARLDLPVTVRDEFREIQVGDLEAMPPDAATWALHNQVFMDWLTGQPDSRFPNGECYHEVWERMRTGLKQVIAGRDEQNIIVVAHGGIFACTLADLCPEADTADLLSRHNHNCSISLLEVDGSTDRLTGQVIWWGDTSHLSGFAAQLVAPVPEDLQPDQAQN